MMARESRTAYPPAMFRRRSDEEKTQRARARGEKRAAMQAQLDAEKAKRQGARDAKVAARAEGAPGSVFISTPCYDSLWSYVVVFPDRVEERKRNGEVSSMRFIRDVSGINLSGGVVELTGSGWTHSFYCNGKDEARRMVDVLKPIVERR